MTVLTNTCEGGTPGVAVTTANSGGVSGTAWDRVENDSPVTYTAGAAHGGVAILCDGASDAYVGWESGIAGTSPTLWARVYFKLAGIPASNTNLFRVLSSSNGIMGTVRVNSSGTLGQLYGTGTLGGTTTLVVTPGQWYRCEIAVTAGTTTGAMETRVYAAMDAGLDDYDDRLVATNVATGAANPSRLRAGVLSNAATVTIDDVALSDEGWIGPAADGGGTVTGAAVAGLGGVAAMATGGRTVGGAAAATLGGVAAAAGARTVHGTAGAAVPLSASGAGRRLVAGAAACALVFTGAASAARSISGTATAVGTVTASAAGVRSVAGAAGSSTALTATAAGSVAATAVAATASSLTAAAAGSRTVHAAAGTAVALAASASGTGGTAGTTTGTAAAALTGHAAATGRRRVTGSASAAPTWTAAAAGTTAVRGSASASAALTAAATVHTTATGAASAVLGALTATAAGRPRSHTQRIGQGRGIMVAHLLNRTLTVWRPVLTPDGSGGFTVDFDDVGEVRAKVDQPKAAERQRADQWGAEHSHNIYLEPDADVRRGDELRGDDQVFRVLATVEPSYAVYLKAPAQLIQSEPDGAES